MIQKSMELFGTLGPADHDTSILKQMFHAGMTGVRLNLSHTELENSKAWLSNLQTAYKDYQKDCGSTDTQRPELLIDLQGPELRIGEVLGPLLVKTGDHLLLTAPDVNSNEIQETYQNAFELSDAITVLPIPCPAIIFPYLKSGQKILLNDGTVSARIILSADMLRRRAASPTIKKNANQGIAYCEVLNDGIISSKKSISLPGIDINSPTLTEMDLHNLDVADRFHVTGIMLPFVRSKEDLITLRKELEKRDLNHLRIFAKIENTAGIDMLPELLPYCDHIVIARGDLGNAVSLPKLIAVQKQIAATCKANGKPFMVVTQMLASMENNAVPTRAEVSDIFNAVLDGADSLMVTGETAVGKYPVEVIKTLKSVSDQALLF